MTIIYPDYDRSILSLVKTILTSYDIHLNNTTKEIDTLHIPQNCKNIILLLFDGMGSDVIEQILYDNNFLLKNRVDNISSVYPCTTAAATRSFYTGQPPISHGFLGWNCYFKECGRNLAILKNRDVYTGEQFEKNIIVDMMLYKSIFEIIRLETHGEILTHHLMPKFAPGGFNSLDDVCEKIQQICKNGRKNFIFLYWDLPDQIMHEKGPYSYETKEQILTISKFLEKISKSTTRTFGIATADHGMKEINRCDYINDEKELWDCLYMPPSLESRCMSLFVKPHKKEKFINIFNERFGQNYILFTRQEIFDKYLFGKGIVHEKVDDFIGDFVACAIGDSMLLFKSYLQNNLVNYKGHHAGLTKEELMIPIIVWEN